MIPGEYTIKYGIHIVGYTRVTVRIGIIDFHGTFAVPGPQQNIHMTIALIVQERIGNGFIQKAKLGVAAR